MADKQARNWLLTLPFEVYSEEEISSVLDYFPRYIGQLEQGSETGYQHWQVYAETDSGVRFSTLKKLFPKTHIESRKGSKRQAIEYCTKEATRVAGYAPLSKGNLEVTSKVGLAELHQMVLDGRSVDSLLVDFPSALVHVQKLRELERLILMEKAQARRDVKCTYLWGVAGCGKTSSVLGKYAPEDVYRVTDYKHPFDGYTGQKVLVLDEFNSDAFDLHLLLNVLDVYPLMLPARYANKPALFDRVWIISNMPLEHQYMWELNSEPELRNALYRRFDEVLSFKDFSAGVRDSVVIGSLKVHPVSSIVSPRELARLLPSADSDIS